MNTNDRLDLVLEPINFALVKVKLVEKFKHNIINELWFPTRNRPSEIGNENLFKVASDFIVFDCRLPFFVP